jgi:cyclopropane-fatty-acyl-phospholipid synthase
MATSSNKPVTHGSLSFVGRTVQSMLDQAGIVLNGPNSWDIQVKDESMLRKLLTGGSLALGESYVHGQWEVDKLDELIHRLLNSPIPRKRHFISHQVSILVASFFNLQKKSRAFHVGEAHYDLGNDIYEVMLDSRMVYTCGYWRQAETLDQAQEAKLELVCRKMGLQQGMRVLDIGCGWGSFAEYAATKHGANVVGVTVSKEQVELAQARCKGLPVEFRLQDYRDIDGQFDAVISLGMFEHVGHKNYRAFMDVLDRCLKPDSLALLHTIGKNESIPGVDPWISKYIFPNGEIPSLKQISEALEPNLIIEDLHNFGPDYDRTLMAWHQNFCGGWGKLQDKYPDTFYRMWTYYLMVCAGAFRARDLQLWQFVISKGTSKLAYRRPDF